MTTNRRLVHDVAMATTTAALERFEWSDADEYRNAFNLIFPAVEAGLYSLIEFSRRERKRLAKPQQEDQQWPDPERS
jgi:hypothetical protein